MPPQSTSSKLEQPQEGLTQRNDLSKEENGKSVDTSNSGIGTTKTKTEWNCMDHILWVNSTWFIILHSAAVYGAYLSFFASWKTFVFAFISYKISMLGITAGAHRLWTHRAYKARLPLRIFLAICNSVGYQNSIYDWSRDHRVHHKYTDTDADPTNSKRGFFFSHIGWLCCKKHPDVKRMGKKIDMSDILNDPVAFYQKKYYALSVILCCFVFPTLIPWYLWGESLWNAFFVSAILRYCFSLNITWLVNSAAHMYGDRPYDKNIAPAENLFVSTFALGEGFHNFHHTFPWDSRASEWGWKINFTNIVLDICALLGLAYDFRIASPEMVKARMARTGKHGSEVLEEHEYM